MENRWRAEEQLNFILREDVFPGIEESVSYQTTYKNVPSNTESRESVTEMQIGTKHFAFP